MMRKKIYLLYQVGFFGSIADPDKHLLVVAGSRKVCYDIAAKDGASKDQLKQLHTNKDDATISGSDKEYVIATYSLNESLI